MIMTLYLDKKIKKKQFKVLVPFLKCMHLKYKMCVSVYLPNLK